MPAGNEAAYFDPNSPHFGKAPRGMYDLMLGLSDLGSKEKTLNKQFALAEELRGTPMPEMRSNHRVTRAANPLEFLNTGIRQALGYSERAKNMKAQTGLADEIRRRIQEERALQQQGRGAPITPQPQQPGMVIPSNYEA